MLPEGLWLSHNHKRRIDLSGNKDTKNLQVDHKEQAYQRLTRHLAEDFAEVVAINAVGYSQGEGPGFEEQAPEKKLPEIPLVPLQYANVKHGFEKCQERTDAKSGSPFECRLIIFQERLNTLIIGLAGINALDNLLIAFHQFPFIHDRNKIHGIVRVIP